MAVNSAPNTRHRVETQFATLFEPPNEMTLESGESLGPITIAYETYGELAPAADNAVLVFHALSGSQHAAGYNPDVPGCPYWTEDIHVGWWDGFIGPGRALDTNKFFVIAANYLGGCYGSTGPSSVNPATGKPYGGSFPRITMSDIVDSQLALLDHLGIKKLLAATGSSIGGMLSMDLAVRFPGRVAAVIPVGSGPKPSMLKKMLNFEQIYAIEEDANFNHGDYYDGPLPKKGLILARMISHKTFVSLDLIQQRARQHIIQEENDLDGYKMQHQIESYFLHQGKKFFSRFDANTHLRVLGAMQAFDLAEQYGAGQLFQALAPCADQHWLIFTIDSDVCFYPEEQMQLSEALKQNGIEYQHLTVHSDKGHDAFLLEPELFRPHIHFLLREVLEKSRNGG